MVLLIAIAGSVVYGITSIDRDGIQKREKERIEAFLNDDVDDCTDEYLEALLGE